MCVLSSFELLGVIVFCRTGVHTVADVFCMGCSERVGWYYVKASDPTQKYKEGECLKRTHVSPRYPSLLLFCAGKYLLERERLIKDNAWKLDEEDE